MSFEMIRTSPTAFSIINLATGDVVFTGELAAVMAEFSRLSLAARGPATVSPKKQARLDQIQEAKQGGMTWK